MHEETAAKRAEPRRRREFGSFALATLSGIVLLAAMTPIGWSTPILGIPAFALAVGLGFRNLYVERPSPAAILAFAAAWGMTLGSVAGMLDRILPGIAAHLIAGTLAGILGPLVFFAAGKVRAAGSGSRALIHLAASLAIYGAAVAALTAAGALPWHDSGFWPAAGILLGCSAAAWMSGFFGRHLDDLEAAMSLESEPCEFWKSSFGALIILAFILLGAR